MKKNNDNHHIWAYNPQSGDNFDTDIYKNEIPTCIAGGSTVIFKYVK